MSGSSTFTTTSTISHAIVDVNCTYRLAIRIIKYIASSAPTIGPQLQGEILIVSNLPLSCNSVTLFRLFGLYGNVMKVKIMYKKRDTALVQMQDA